MLYAEDFRKIARDSLNKKWALAVGTGLVASLLNGYISSNGNVIYKLSSKDPTTTYIQQWLQTPLGKVMLPWISGIVIILFVLAIITIVIGGAVSLGYSNFNLNLVDKKEARFSDLFSQFDRIGAGFCMRFLIGLYTFLWTLLLIIPGIIASYSYAMTPYIMSEHPEYGANEAIGYSKELMRGNKWRLFCMWFSFIGWDILCVFSLGIGFLWLIPYQEAATAAFYREITK